MRRVFRGQGSEVAHHWAHQNYERGRGNGAISFDGPALYSYNALIGYRHTIGTHAEPVFLLSSRSWSITTGRHQGYAARAVFGDYFFVPKPGASTTIDHRENYLYLRGIFESSVQQLANKRQRRITPESARRAMDVANRYAELFDMPDRLEWSDDVEKLAAEMIERDRVYQEHQRAREIVQWQEKLIRAAEEAAAWERGETNAFPSHGVNPVLLRVLPGSKGDAIILETSLGVRVPLEDAKRAFEGAVACRRQGRGVDLRTASRPVRVGDFLVEEIKPDGSIKAGCHFLRWPQMERLALELGLLKEPVPQGVW